MQWLFSDCILDPERREVCRGSRLVATTPKVFDLLLHLIAHRNRVVSRDELIEKVWNGRVVSESTIASQINAVRVAVGDDGQKQNIIKTIPRKGFRFVAELVEQQISAQPGIQTTAPSLSSRPHLVNKPSIAVLPFTNLSGDPAQDYLIDGVVEDIIIALSQYRWLFVIARNSSFTYKDNHCDAKQMGRDLSVRYVLEGSWRQAQGRVRITGNLIDTETGVTHWAGRFEGVLVNLFDFQDQIADSVVSAIAPQLEQAEIMRARFKATENLDAYDYYLRGMAHLHRGSQEEIKEAIPLFQQAISYDPDFSSAYAMAAWCYCWRKINGWINNDLFEIAEGLRLARKAIELGQFDAVALARSGHTLCHLSDDREQSIALLTRAQELNPNLAAARFLGAFCHLWYGQAEEAVTQFSHAMKLSPVDPELYRMQIGMASAHYFLGNFLDAEKWAEESTANMPNLMVSQTILAASQAMLGKLNEAHITARHLQTIAPSFRLESLGDWLPIRDRLNYELLSEGLIKAGF